MQPPSKFLLAFAAISPSKLKLKAAEDLISDELLENHSKDLNYVESLTHSTLTCGECHKRHLIDQAVDGVNYCQCDQRPKSVYGLSSDNSPWTPFLERKDILVWRREHPSQPGMYAYKMYGKFDDVSAQEFLAVQLDLSEFRLKWDPSTAQCHVIDEQVDDNCNNNESKIKNVSQIYYWEVNWPRMFSNRDYVCSRRAKVFNQNNDVIVVYTKSTEHRACPKKPKTFRVEDYWSVLTIKPFQDFDSVGIEFSLTAFENPGVCLPSSITTWVAIRAMPEFMENLRKACLERRKWLQAKRLPPTSSSQQAIEPSYMETPQQYRSEISGGHSYA